MDNATCRIVLPKTTVNRTDPLTRDHDERTQDEQRCSLRRMSIHAETNALGAAGAATWRLRLQSTLDIGVGWTISARLDGEDDWHDYQVGRAAKNLHWDLLVQRVG